MLVYLVDNVRQISVAAKKKKKIRMRRLFANAWRPVLFVVVWLIWLAAVVHGVNFTSDINNLPQTAAPYGL